MGCLLLAPAKSSLSPTASGGFSGFSTQHIKTGDQIMMLSRLPLHTIEIFTVFTNLGLPYHSCAHHHGLRTSSVFIPGVPAPQLFMPQYERQTFCAPPS